MSKRMHIYAAAIDPLRKKRGVPARAVADIVLTTMSQNEKLAAENAGLHETNGMLRNLETEVRAEITLIDAERAKAKDALRVAMEKIGELEAKLAAATPTTVEFMRFSPPPAPGGIIHAHRVEPVELVVMSPGIEDWVEFCGLNKITGAVYDGGDFCVVSIRTLAEQMGPQPLVDSTGAHDGAR